MPATKTPAKAASKKSAAKARAAKKPATPPSAAGKAAPRTAATASASASASADRGVAVAAAPTYAWAEVVRRAKAPTDTEQALYAVRIAPDLLRREGIKIASDRILTDALRWSGTLVDFVASAAPELVRGVRGFSPGLMRVFVAEAYRLYELNQRFQADRSASRASAKVDKAAASSSRKLAQSYRRQLFEAIKGAAQQEGTILSRLAAAAGATELRAVMQALVTLARELIADQSSPVSQRLTLGGVDAAYLTTVESLAEQTGATGTRVTGPKKSVPVSQGELDVQDGVCLALMDQLLVLFEVARAIDPRVPALVPNATRRYFGGYRQTAKVAATPATPPSA